MAGNSDKKNIRNILIFLSLMTWILNFQFFLKDNLWWIFLVFVYFLFFIGKDFHLKSEEINEKLRKKDRREIRINF